MERKKYDRSTTIVIYKKDFEDEVWLEEYVKELGLKETTERIKIYVSEVEGK